MKIIGIYKITNTITGDFYIGSSKDVKHRWENHKCPSALKNYPNNPMYLDMQKYGTDKFDFQILAEVEIGQLKEKEQWFIEKLKPTYNSIRANGIDIERKKEYHKKYKKSDKHKEYQKKYQKSDKHKEYQKKYQKEYQNKICSYNGEVLTLRALYSRFRKAGIEHPAIEAKKYILTNSKDK